jgi:hypothetical protein
VGLRVRVRRVNERARREGGMSGCDAGGRVSASEASSSFCKGKIFWQTVYCTLL